MTRLSSLCRLPDRLFRPATFVLPMLLAAAATFVSCSKSAPEWEEPVVPVADALLKVKTRSTESDNTLALPIRIYAFRSDNTLAATQTMTTDGEAISLPLSAGSYTIYALTGASAARYEIPTGENLVPSSAVALLSGEETHGELGSACDQITLTNGETTQLTLSVTRIVAQLTASLTNIPDDITAISIRVSPLYTGFSIDGTLTGSDGSHTVALTKKSAGVWGTDAPHYVLPGTANATVTITMTRPSGAMDYTYASDVPFSADYQLHVAASYESVPELEGSITGTDWAGSNEISFSFGPGTSVEGTPVEGDENGGSGGGETPISGLPTEGESYRGCYVLSVTPTGALSADLLLVSPRQWPPISVSDTDEALAAANERFESFAPDGITGWHLPGPDETLLLMEAFRESFDELNATITTGGPLSINADYIFLNSNGDARKAKFGIDTVLPNANLLGSGLSMLAVCTLSVVIE